MTESLLRLTMIRLKLFFREPSAVFWSFGFPLLLTIALGIAYRDRTPDPVAVAILEGPRAELILAQLRNNAEVRAFIANPSEAAAALTRGSAAVVISSAADSQVTFRYDPSRPEQRIARRIIEDALQRAAGRADPITAADETVSEKGGRYIDFLIPGLIGMNIMSNGMWGVGFVIVEERTKKLLKRMLATPMKRGEFLLSFILMRIVFLGVELPVLLLFGWATFSVTVQGSWLLLILVALSGALAFAGIGLLVGSRARNIQTVSGLMNLVMLPMFVCSGVFFSSANFPDLLQPFIQALPLTALNNALRAVINEGAGFSAVAAQIALLAAYTAASFAAALKIFRWN